MDMNLGHTIQTLHSFIVAVAFNFVCHVIFYAVLTRLQCCEENKINVWVDFVKRPFAVPGHQ